MILKKWIIENIHDIIILGVFLICIYSSIFIDHHEITYILLSIVAIQCIFTLKKNQTLFSNKKNNETTSNKRLSPHIFQKWNWLKYDTPLFSLCLQLSDIQHFNKPIFHNVCKISNDISKKYYKEILKSDKNMYSNLEKHKYCIQYLEDKGAQIVDLLKELEFGTTNERYLYKYNIPNIIENFQNLIKDKVTLLKHKRELR